jgi:hypothetical protein
MSTIHQDVSEELNDGIDAEDAFSKLWKLDAPQEPSGDNDEDDQQDTAEDKLNDDAAEGDDEGSEETPETDEDAEGDEDDGDNEPTVEIKDDHKVKVSVDGEEREFTFGSLKRLAGQEASLTRKSQEVATQRKAVGEHGAVLLAQSHALLTRAKERYAPYANIDLLAAAKDPNISAEELVAVRNAAKLAYEDVQYLESETSRVAEALRYQARQELMEQAQESLKTLQDPDQGIEGFNQQLYGDICNFAVEQGLPAELVNDLVNPAAIKLINMARLYMKGQKAVQTAKSDTKKAPKRIVKATTSPDQTRKVIKTAKANEPMKRLQNSGSVDDAAAAFEARWTRQNED